MGDRANIRLVLEEDKPSLNLYTHWGGYRWHLQLADALKFGKNRWDDPAYLTRILISRLYIGHAEDETGGGISFFQIGGDGYPLYIVDIPNQKVHQVDEDHPEDVAQTWTFAEYVDADHHEHGEDYEEEDDY